MVNSSMEYSFADSMPTICFVDVANAVYSFHSYTSPLFKSRIYRGAVDSEKRTIKKN